jgi:hypothetical protein
MLPVEFWRFAKALHKKRTETRELAGWVVWNMLACWTTEPPSFDELMGREVDPEVAAQKLRELLSSRE